MTGVNETEQGQLVHQILKTQKELNESVVADKSQNKQLQIVSILKLFKIMSLAH